MRNNLFFEGDDISARLSRFWLLLLLSAVIATAGAVADISDTLPGVAIAISLVPPLAVVGLSLESGSPGDAFGAFVLFVANVSAILVTGLVVVTIYRVHRLATGTASAKGIHRGRAAVVIVLALVLVSIPLTAVSFQLRQTNRTQTTVSGLADSWASAAGWDVLSVESDLDGVVVRAVGPLPEPDAATLQRSIAGAGLATTAVTVELVPSYVVTFGGSGGG